MAVPAGQVSHTGVAGLTLGGGVGYLMRKHGLTIDSLLAAQVVTAAGETVRASAQENPDLFWGLRGDGGNFGVVTEFTFELHELGPIVYAGVLAYSYERAGEVLRASRELMQHAPNELSIHEILITIPEHDPFPPRSRATERCSWCQCTSVATTRRPPISPRCVNSARPSTWSAECPTWRCSR
jgi:hypothetical protein